LVATVGVSRRGRLGAAADGTTHRGRLAPHHGPKAQPLWSSACALTCQFPPGTVTLLFADIEGSTRLLQELGDEYADVLADHRRTLRAEFARHGGVEVDTEGDAFFVAFAKASDAVAAATAVREALGRGPIRVRMGLHTGEPTVTEEGYVGIDVHRAARIAAAGHGGQILVSQATRDLAGADRLRDLGVHRLKDLAAPDASPARAVGGTSVCAKRACTVRDPWEESSADRDGC
jgi:class 3 adenylate cyclase